MESLNGRMSPRTAGAQYPQTGGTETSGAIQSHTQTRRTNPVQLRGAARRDGVAPSNQYGLPSSCSGAVNTLWQTTLVQTESEFIACGRSKIRQTVVQLENECCRYKSAKATAGSPLSSRQSVSRLTKRRAAMSLVEMPRLRRASARSRPSLRSAWVAGNGIEPVFDMRLVSCITDIMSNNVLFVRQ